MPARPRSLELTQSSSRTTGGANWTALCHPSARCLLDHHPALDEVICWSKEEWRQLVRNFQFLRLGGDITAFSRDLRQRRFDLALDARLFIAREGITRRDDALPKRFVAEPAPEGSGPSAGSVVELEPMLDEYYRARGWDVESGLPTEKKLEELGLGGS